MPEPYEVLNARVKQKIATEAQWISEEDEFGVIFEGEQTFVKNEDGTPVNFKIGDGTKKFSELAYFIAYYSNITNQKVLPFLDRSANITIASIFRINSYLTDIIFLNTGGTDITLNIGTTDGGSELASIPLGAGVSTIGLKKYFDSVETVYLTGLDSASFSVFILYIQLDEAPAIPPTSSTPAFKFPKGYAGIFEPLYPGHENDVWDFVTGLAKPDTGYDNCALSGTNGTKSRGGKYSIGFNVGDTIGSLTGNATNSIFLTIPQLPVFTVNTRINAERYATQNSGSDHPYGTATPYVRQDILKSDPIGGGQAIDIKPGSIIDLYFVAIS